MKNRKLFLTLVLCITFIVGFSAGAIYSNPKSQAAKTIKIEELQQSTKQPEQKALPELETSEPKVLAGYIQDFRDPNIVDYSKLTHVFFSFAHPTRDGGVLLNGDSAISNLRTMVANAAKHNTKVILAVGGWFHITGGQSYDHFKAAISNPAARTKLVNELITIVEQEKLDGIDIDFEHPRSKEDAKNLTAFAKELHDKLQPKGKELSIAVYAKIHAVTGTEVGFVIYEPELFQYVDHVNIMAYDGQWDGGYNAANLSPYPFTEKVVSYWADLFDQHKLAKEKLVLGVPFYAQSENPEIKQVSFAAIVKQNPDHAEKDTVAMNGTTYHYNGIETMQRKTNLALAHGFGGMMIWEAGHDAAGQNSLTAVIYNELQKPKLVKN